MKSLPKFLILLLAFFVVLNIVLAAVYLSKTSKDKTSKTSPLSFLEKMPKPGSCLILEEKYCQKGKLISDPWDPKGLLAAYKIPKGTSLFAPVEGYYSHTPVFFFESGSKEEVIKYPGATITISQDNTAQTTSGIWSFIYFKERENIYSIIKKGEIMGLVSDRTIDYLGDYNLIVGLTKQQFVEGRVVFERDTEQLKKVLNLK